MKRGNNYKSFLKSIVQIQTSVLQENRSMKERIKSIKENLKILQSSKPRKKSYDKKNDSKSKIVNHLSIKQSKPLTKQSEQTKKYLQKTLAILSHRFNVKSMDSVNRSSSIHNLSSSVYKIVKQNLSTLKRLQNDQKQNKCLNGKYGACDSLIKSFSKQHDKIKDQVLRDSRRQKNSNSKSQRDSNRQVIVSDKQNCRQRASSALGNHSVLDVSSICHQNSIICQQNSIICQPNMPSSTNSIFVKRRSNSTLDTYFRQKFGAVAEDQEAVQKKLRVIKALKKSQQIVNKSNRSHIQSSMVLSNIDLNDRNIVMEKLKNKKSEKLK